MDDFKKRAKKEFIYLSLALFLPVLLIFLLDIRWNRVNNTGFPIMRALGLSTKMMLDFDILNDEVADMNNGSNRDWSKYAFAIKTGLDIYKDRTPILFETYLKRIDNKILIAEGPGQEIDDVPLVDVYSKLYEGFTDEDGRNLTFYMATKAKDAESDLNTEEVKPSEKSFGWIADAHKNLPGFRSLFEFFPYANWYMMIDDDSYVFLDNLDDFLSSYDHNLPYYFGAANIFTMCDGVENWLHGSIFAHGGSGILLSRGAIMKLLDSWTFCIIRYHDCWAGDVRLGLCLRNEGVLLTNLKTFHTNPPNDRTIYSHPCSRPITFHHLLHSQITNLFNLELKVTENFKGSNSFVTMENLMDNWIDGRPRENTDREGDEFAIYSTAALQSCIELCKNTPQCIAYSFSSTASTCSLKSKVNELKRKANVTSGVNHKNFKCSGEKTYEEALEMDIGL
jgi:hypothetical protein